MFGLTIPFAIEATRRNPVRPAIRNLAMSQGDDLQLVITVYASDGTPVDISQGAVTASVQREAWGCSSGASYDYGLGWLTTSGGCVWTGIGIIKTGTDGIAVVSIPRAVTSAWWGRFRLRIAIDDAAGGCIAAEGILDVRHRPGLPPLVFAPPGQVGSGGDFAASDFATSDFWTGVAAGAPGQTGVPVIGSSGFLLDDFGNRLTDDFNQHIVTG